MNNKSVYMKKKLKYIIGAAALTTSLSSAAFGLTKDNYNYYKIYNKDDLKEFANLVNSGRQTKAKGKLMDDIVFEENSKSWTPIGTTYYPFEGKLVSGDYLPKTITGLYINKTDGDFQGLFGYIGKDGVISDINVNNSTINGGNYVGGIAGYNKGTIQDCSTNNVITGNYMVGGLVGQNEGTIKGVRSNGSVEGKDDVGGIVGCNIGPIQSGISIKSCENFSEVQGISNVGGIIGQNTGLISANCINDGPVKGKEKSVDIGGNIGYNGYKNMETEILGMCENKAAVTGSFHVGGNFGCNEGIISNDCKNSGPVKGKEFIGGNVGFNTRHVVIYGEIKGNCNNTAEIQGISMAGGNIGVNEGKILNNCKNSGPVTGKDHIGGNVGFDATKVENICSLIEGKCENTGEVIIQESNVEATEGDV